MENKVSPIRWDEYSSDESFDDNDYDIESIRIKEEVRYGKEKS